MTQEKMTREDWNQIYEQGEMEYERQPNRFLMRALDLIKQRGLTQGLLLDCAMGEGRNTVYAALQGFTAHGFDISDKAMDNAHQRAAEMGVEIYTRQAEAETYDYGTAKWDVILVLFYPAIRLILDRIKKALKPGGYLVLASPMVGMEKVAPELHPDILDNLYEPGELAQTFLGYEILVDEEILNEYMDFFFQIAKIPWVQFLARKPLAD
jgi:2-polyprenyl-3-methyl-5-hydroxy-6-metoxy-1,4-benzoquinol methylase